MSEDWKTYLTPHLTYVVQNLRPMLVLDKLREKQLLASEECTQLHNMWRQVSDQECCRHLLDILFKKGPDSFRGFLEVLRSTPGQEHIANKMKPMDTSSSSVREQQDRKSQLDDASGIATVKMYPPSSSQQRELPMVSSEQEELLLQSLIAVKADLRPALLLDDLLSNGILTEQEYKQLQQGSLTERERSHRLLHDILPSKNKGSVTVFCEVLDQIEGQKHVLKGETEATSLGKVTEVEVICQSHRPNGNGAASKEDQLPGTEHMACQQGMASVLNQDVPSTSKKWKQHSTPSKVSRRNFATFFFKPELRESVSKIEKAISSMCAESFGIEKELIMFAYTKMADLHPFLEAWGHPCFMDLDSKLAVLVVEGTKQPVDTDTRQILEGLIVTYLQKVKHDLGLYIPHGEGRVVEIITGSSFIVLSLSTDLYISLLCALGSKELQTELNRLLKEALPGSNKAVLRLGGLPPLELFNDLADVQNSAGEDQCGAVVTEKTPVVASKENYGNVLGEGDVSAVVQKESDPALEGLMSSLQDSTVEIQSADVHKLLLAESSRDTSKDQYDGNLLGATNVTSATQSEFQQPILHEQRHLKNTQVVRPRPSRDDSTMTNSRQRKRTTANKHRDNTNETTKMRKGHAQAVTMSEVAVSLIIAAIIILSILLYWWNTSTREDTKTNNRMTESINNKYKHPMQEDSGARETDNEQEHSRSSQSTQSVSFSQQYDSLSDDIDRDMLPSDPSEDPMDFDDHASFTGSFDQQNKLTHLDNFPEKSRKPPQYLKRDWWVDVIEKIEGREHIKLHSNPDVYEVPNFLTIGECYELIKAYERLHRRKIEKPSWCFSDEMWLNDVMHASKIKKYEVTQSYDEDQGHMCVEGEKVSETFPKQLKYSSAVLLPRGEDMHVDQVEFKVGQWGLPTENAYHTQLLKYRGNEEYQPHTDCHNHSNDRMGTILIYLNDVKEGGETVFTALNISVSPKRGTAIIWKSLDADGKCDKRTLHASAVLKSGMKYVYQKWFHQMQLLPQYDSDNVLCDNSRSCREYIHSPETRQATTKMLEAETLVSSKRFKDALTLYQEAIKIQPNHSMSLVYGADVLMRLGRKHEALHWFQKALKLHPKHVDSNFITANILQEQNKLGLAVQHLEVVVEMSPQDSDAFFNLGAMYADTKRQEEAVVMLQKVVQLSPNDAEAHGELGALLSDMGKEDEAEVHYAKAKELMKQRRKKKRQ